MHSLRDVFRPSKFVALRSLRRQLIALDADVVLHPMLSPFATGLLVGRLAKHSIVGFHDVIAHPGLRNWLLSLWERTTLSRANRLLLFSNWAAAHVSPRLVRRPPLVIPHGPLDYYTRIDLQAEPARDEIFRVLVFGRSEQYKDGVLVAALARLCPDVEFVVAGTVAQRNNVELALEPNVTLHNRWIADDQVGPLFRACDAVVLPYTSMTQSGVIALAAAFAKPVVCADIGAAREQLGPAAGDLLVDTVTAEALADRLHALAADRARTRDIGAALAAHHVGPYSWRVGAERILQSIEDDR